MRILQHAGGLMYFLDGTPFWVEVVILNTLESRVVSAYDISAPQRLMYNIRRK